MKSGKIDQFAHLSEFKTLKEFNGTITQFLDTHGHHFTKSERIALFTLTQFSAKHIGVCNARIAKLVEAAQAQQGGISRSSFERMLRKAKKLGILSIHHTLRIKGGLSHNVYVFHPFDGATTEKLTDRHKTEKPAPPKDSTPKTQPDTLLLKTIKPLKEKELRTDTIEELDASFVPSSIPTTFVRAVKPFFSTAKEIDFLWQRVRIAYRSLKFTTSVEELLQPIIQAFKECVYRYKQNQIRTTFVQYFYRTVEAVLLVEKRRIVANETGWGSWLMG